MDTHINNPILLKFLKLILSLLIGKGIGVDFIVCKGIKFSIKGN